MPIRTDASAVLSAIETDLTTPQIEAFIDDASVWVDANLLGDSLSATVLEKIEKYLACHFITLRDPRLKSATAGDVAEVYVRELYVTEYLKAAMALDPTGKIADAFGDRSKKFRMTYRVGTGYADE